MTEWGCISYEHSTVEQALERWYDQDSAVSEWRFVCRIAVAADQREFQMRMRDQDPYERPCYLFYSVREVTRTVQVRGCISWHNAMALRGRIDLQRDLVKSRDFLCYHCPEEAGLFNRAAVEEEITWLPLNLPRSELPHHINMPMHQLFQELDCILHGRGEESSSAVRATLAVLSALVETRLGHMYSVPDTPADMRVIQKRFHDARMAHVHRWLILDVGNNRSEETVLKMLMDNGIEEYMEDAMLTAASPVDRQCFLTRWPGAAPPDFMLRVPMEELPADMVTAFALHEGGLARISYKDVPHWLWQVYTVQTARVVAFPLAPEALSETQIPDLLDEMARIVARYYIQHVSEPKKKARGTIAYDAPDAAGVDLDQGELADLLPPCMRAIATAPQFPRDQERLWFLVALQTAGVSSETLFAWFEAKNDAYPAAFRDAKSRWNYEYAWRVGYGFRSCELIIADTKAGKEHVVLCPFAQGAKGLDIEDYKVQCAGPGAQPFSGPHNLIRRALYRRAPIKAPF